MAILISHLSGLTTGSIMLLINLPLMVLGYYCLGQGFVWRTVIAVLAVSGWVDLFNEVLAITALTDDLLLASLYGGAAIGVGVGLILKGNASAGGPTIIARIVAQKTSIRPGQLILAMDALIVCSSAMVFGAIEPALLSLLSVFVTGRTIDLVLKNNDLRAKQISPPNCSGSTA